MGRWVGEMVEDVVLTIQGTRIIHVQWGCLPNDFYIVIFLRSKRWTSISNDY